MEPFQGGGEMIKSVSMNDATWNDIPYKFEAGTPNIAQAIGLGAAVEYINELGVDNVHQHGEKLTKYAMDKLNQINGLNIQGNQMILTKQPFPKLTTTIEFRKFASKFLSAF